MQVKCEEGQAREEDAKSRLVALLDYCKEVAALSHKEAEPTLSLRTPSETSKDEGGHFVLHEGFLRRLQELKHSDGNPVVWLHSGDDSALGGAESGMWMRVRRPDGTEARKTPLGVQACEAYAALFSTHQEALREGRGAQLTVGVGFVRWRVSNDQVIDHPLVMMPADLTLDEQGAFVVRMADAAQATLWSFPGVPQAATALVALEKVAKECHLVGTSPPPPKSGRWGNLLFRAAHCLAADGVYVETAPKVTPKGGLHGAPEQTPRVYNGFVLWTRHEGGERGICEDANELARALRSMPPKTLPSALARLAGVYGLPAAPNEPPPPPPQYPIVSYVKRLLA